MTAETPQARREFLHASLTAGLLSLGNARQGRGLDAGLEPAPDLIRNVRTYGAAGDGQHDDSEAIQRAIDDGSGGGTVFFPQGRYRLGKPIHLRSDLVLLAYGRHTALIPDTAGGDALVGRGVKRVFLEGLYIDGERGSGHGVVFENCDDARVRRCWIKGVGGNGIMVTDTPCSILDSTIELGGGSGIVVTQTNSGNPTHVIDCYVYSNAAQGLMCHHNANQAMVVGCEIIRNGENGILLDDVSRMGSVANNLLAGNKANGIDVRRGSALNTLTGNALVENGRHGIALADGSDATVITANRFIDNGLETEATYNGINIRNTHDTVVLGNVFTNTVSTRGHIRGVDVGTGLRLQIQANIFSRIPAKNRLGLS